MKKKTNSYYSLHKQTGVDQGIKKTSLVRNKKQAQ